MRPLFAALLLLPPALAAGSAGSSAAAPQAATLANKVLLELIAGCKRGAAAEQAAREKQVAFCAATRRATEESIVEARAEERRHRAAATEADASLAAGDAGMEKASAQVAGEERRLQEATATREGERKRWLRADGVLADNLEQLGKVGDALQGTSDRALLQSAVTGLLRGTSSAASSFLQLDAEPAAAEEGGAPLHLALLSGASASSQQLLELLRTLKSELQTKRTTARSEETQLQQQFSEYLAAGRRGVAALEAERAAAQKQIAAAKQARAVALKEASAAEQGGRARKAKLSALVTDCAGEGEAFADTQSARAAELDTYQEARIALTDIFGGRPSKLSSSTLSKARAFLQARSRRALRAQQSDSAFVQLSASASYSSTKTGAEALALVIPDLEEITAVDAVAVQPQAQPQGAAPAYPRATAAAKPSVPAVADTEALLQLVATARGSQLAGVRKLVEQMIAKLMGEQSADADKSAWCRAEKGKTDGQLGKVQAKHDALAARASSAAAGALQCATKRKAAVARLAWLRDEVAQGAAVFASQHSQLLARQREAGATRGQLQQVVSKLSAFAASKAGALVASKTADDSPGMGGVVELLEVAVGDSAREESAAVAKALTTKSAHDDYLKSAAAESAAGAAEIEGLRSLCDQLRREQVDAGNDLSDVKVNLTDLQTYSSKLDGDCGGTQVSLEEKISRRGEQMKSLQSALATLGG